MKKNSYLLVFALMIGAVMMTSCDALKKMKEGAGEVQYTVNPPVLELIGDQVAISINGTYPAGYFNKKVTAVLTPTLVAGDNELAYEEYGVQGEAVEGNYKVISSDGGSFSYKSTITYDPKFKKSELMLYVTASRKDKELVFDPYKLADGIITTALLVDKTGEVIYAPDAYVRVVPGKYEADIKYNIQQADVRPTESKKEEMKTFTEAVKAANANERVKFTSAEVSSYASPDGPYELNDKLATNRGTSGKNFFKSTFKTAKVDALTQDDFLKVVSTPEDWDGFKALVEKSNITDKELVLRVLSMYSDPEVRDREMHNLANAFKDIKDQILPQLRRSKMTVNVEVVGRSDEEITEQFDKDASVLSVEELLRAGSLANSVDKKLAIYAVAAKNFASDWRTKNNYGAALLEAKRVAEAKTVLEEALSINDNETVKNNLGVIALRNGDMAKAEELFSGSAAATKHNLAAVKISQGHYADAITLFGSDKTYNAGLVKLLAKEFDPALNVLNSLNGDDACVAYLKAIIGARTNNKEVALANLRKACKESEKKAYAKEDIEFVAYFGDADFKAIVE